MNARFTIAVLALGAGCAQEPQGSASNEVLETLAAHRAADIDPEGEWIDLDDRGAWFLHVERQADLGCWALRNEFLRLDRPGVPSGGARPEPRTRLTWISQSVFTTSGVLSDGVLSLESPLGRSSRLHLCRFADKELLLPEKDVRFEGGSIPSGMVFRRLDRAPGGTPVLSPAIPPEGYLPGPDDENRPMRREIDETDY